MSGIRGLIIGIVLVIISISLLLGSGGGILPWLGALIGLVGAFFVLRIIFRGNIH